MTPSPDTRARDADGLCALFAPELWPHGCAPFDLRFEPDPRGGWRWSAELWVPDDEPALTGPSLLGQVWWHSGWERDAAAAMRSALRAGVELEAERDGALVGVFAREAAALAEAREGIGARRVVDRVELPDAEEGSAHG